MLTEEQKRWVAHLSNEKLIKIIPYNQKTKEVFKKIKNEIKSFLGDAEILHCGSTALEILGQGEIDLYVPVLRKDFDYYLVKLVKNLGKPGSIYPLERVRFVKFIDGIKIEIFLINKENDGWKNSVKFESYLKENPDALEDYKNIKEECDGLTVQSYYRKKIEFINKILKCHKKNQSEQ
jgi:GrpB-like predicted nucleotidyltransferase (UPF0157 family)